MSYIKEQTTREYGNREMYSKSSSALGPYFKSATFYKRDKQIANEQANHKIHKDFNVEKKPISKLLLLTQAFGDGPRSDR
jgi:hypothetical protein